MENQEQGASLDHFTLLLLTVPDRLEGGDRRENWTGRVTRPVFCTDPAFSDHLPLCVLCVFVVSLSGSSPRRHKGGNGQTGNFRLTSLPHRLIIRHSNPLFDLIRRTGCPPHDRSRRRRARDWLTQYFYQLTREFSTTALPVGRSNGCSDPGLQPTHRRGGDAAHLLALSDPVSQTLARALCAYNAVAPPPAPLCVRRQTGTLMCQRRFCMDAKEQLTCNASLFYTS